MKSKVNRIACTHISYVVCAFVHIWMEMTSRKEWTNPSRLPWQPTDTEIQKHDGTSECSRWWGGDPGKVLEERRNVDTQREGSEWRRMEVTWCCMDPRREWSPKTWSVEDWIKIGISIQTKMSPAQSPQGWKRRGDASGLVEWPS